MPKNLLDNLYALAGIFKKVGPGTIYGARCLKILFILYLLCSAVPRIIAASAESEIGDVSKIEVLTKQILEKEIEIERLNTRFRIETTLISPWQQRRVFVYGETNASCTEAGILTVLPARYKLAHLKSAPLPEGLRRRILEAAQVQMVGQFFNAAGDVVELGLNFKNYLSLRNRSFNPAMYRNRIRDLHASLDNLIEQHYHVLQHAHLPDADMQAALAEAELLHGLRDLSLIEYSRSLSSARKFWAYQNTAFLVDFAKNTTSASSNILTLAADHSHHPHLSGSSGLMQMISGVITLVTPVVGRVTGNMSGLAARRVSSRELTDINVKSVDAYSKEKEHFLAAVSHVNENSPYLTGARKRISFYNQEENLLQGMHQYLLKQRKDAHGTTVENVVFASIVAPPRIANGTLGMIAGWHYYDDRTRANKLYAGGNTAYVAGNSFNMFETARVWVSAELSDHRAEKIRMLPRQQFNDRLRALDDMEQGLK